MRGRRLAAHQVRSQLLDRLAAWQREFDDNFHWDRGWRSAQIRDRWASQAEELAADVRAELGTRAELTVRLWPLPGVVRRQRRFGLRRSNDRQAIAVQIANQATAAAITTPGTTVAAQCPLGSHLHYAAHEPLLERKKRPGHVKDHPGRATAVLGRRTLTAACPCTHW
ncbi:MAG TPA: hypothetical protein VKD66_18580 [Streptosporangiaceae bacterium]|nr:hypothetical protein [Streptosporangiaceae bacterium]